MRSGQPCACPGRGKEGDYRYSRRDGGCEGTRTRGAIAAPGRTAWDYQDETLRGLNCRRVEPDEIWSFCYAKEANVPAEHKGEFGFGDGWKWVVMDADTKLVHSWLVGERDTPTAIEFMQDVRGRIANRTQLTTDGLVCYLTAVEKSFGADGDYAQLVKIYSALTLPPSGAKVR